MHCVQCALEKQCTANHVIIRRLRSVLEGFVGTMHEADRLKGLDVLFAQARVHRDNKPRRICVNHDYNVIPPCHLGIQKLHIHWRYPSGSGIYSHTAATSRPHRVDSEAIGAPLRCCLPWRHHRVTWITWLRLWRNSHLPNSKFFIAPEQYIFHSNCERR